MARVKQAESGYAILVEPLSAAEGGGWLATVPALPGCTGDGETPEAALADAEGAIAEWIDAARQSGRDVPGASAAAAGEANAAARAAVVSSPDSRVEVLVLPTDEERMIATHVLDWLSTPGRP